jgi:ABC-type polar amino acid transport system ATPase subunit
MNQEPTAQNTLTAPYDAGGTTMPPPGTPLVHAKNLRKEFYGRAVLDGVDFDVTAGQVNVIIGKSGSGKSTLLRVIAGLEEPEDGDVTIDGKLVRSEGKRTADWSYGAAKVGMVFQTYTLWPHMNVLENLTLAPRKILKMGADEAEQRAHTALSEVGMEHHIRSRSTQLSGGERQRVAIARALMMRPEVLLCDEITSALDPPVAAEVLGVLARLKEEEGPAVCLVTHDMAFASKAADRVVFFLDGRIAVDASPEAAFHQCENAELKAFVDAVRID